ncbi:MAG: ABC transporter substrate-binding protein [Chloroflexota bacterium]
MRKTVIFMALAVLLALTSIHPIAAQDKPVLKIAWWGSQSRHDRTIKVIDMYKATHPDIDITYDFAGFNDYWTKLTTQASGGKLPCLMQQDYAYLAEWVKQGLVVPLDDFIKQGLLNVSDVPDPVLAGGRINDKLYGLNLGINSQSIILDVDAFKKAGIDLPAPNWTWADFDKIVTQLHDKLGIWGMGPALSDEQLWKSLYLGNGEWAFNNDGNEIGYKDDKPIIDYFKMIMNLQDAKAVPGQDTEAQYTKAGPEGAPIVTSKAAMQYQWSNQVVAVWKASGDGRHFKLAPLPRIVGGKSANYIKPSMFFSITSQCETPELAKEAAKFMDYFTNSKEANDILFAERGVPVSTKILDYLQPKLDPATAETFAFLSLVGKDVSPIPPPDPAGWADIRNNIYMPQFVEAVLFKQISPEDGAKLLRDEANKILAKNKK